MPEPATERDERDRPLTREELAPYNARRLTPEQHAARLRAHPRDGLPVVERREDLPAGMSFEEARAFWDTHRPGEGLVGPPPGRASRRKAATAIGLRLEADTVHRLRRLAEKKGTKYQTLLKQFVVERLYEEEKREGLVAAPE